MSEAEIIAAWRSARWHIIASQLGPTFLLALTIGFLLAGLGTATLSVKIAAAGILLASGVLGAAAQITAADEGVAAADELKARGPTNALGRRVAASGRWMLIVKYVTPAIFVAIYAALLWAIFLS